jgi:hypothetical protein
LTRDARAPTALELPDFNLPFPRTINPWADLVVRHTVGWARAVGLVEDRSLLAQLERDGIVHAGPRLAPTATLERACLISDWTLFLIVLDDEFDEGELGSHPDRAAVVVANVLAGTDGGVARALANLRRRFERLAPTREWLQRFSLHADEHIASKVIEAKERASGRLLDVADYVKLRRVTGAPYCYADLAELASGAIVPDAIRASRDWEELRLAFADVFLAVQDICSCGKEVASGDDLNLVVALQRMAGSSLQEAVGRANDWLRDRAGSFAETSERVTLAGSTGSEVRRCIDALERMLGGHLAWNSGDNPRYTSYATAEAELRAANRFVRGSRSAQRR